MVEKEILNILEIIEDRLKLSSDNTIYYSSGELYENKYVRLNESMSLEKELDILKLLENKTIIQLKYHVEIDRKKTKTNTTCSIVVNLLKLKNRKRHLTKKLMRKNKSNNDGKIIFLEPEESNKCPVQFESCGNVLKKGTKGYALIKILTENGDVPFELGEIKEFCNPLIVKSEHFFKKEKDVDDTIREIKAKLKIGKKAYFPIIKQDIRGTKSWKLVDKSG